MYDFTVYISTEVGKHRHSLQLSIGDTSIRVYNKVKNCVNPRVKRSLPLMRKIFRCFTIFVFIRLIYLGINELMYQKYEVNIWEQLIDKTEIYLLELLNSGEIRLMLTKFHNFADWISKEDNIDMAGIEL